jgi:hypothetical protein
MNDNNALGAVRDYLATAKDSLAEVHMTTPPDTIVRNGRARRRRHRLTGLAGATAVAAALATAVLLPASHPISHPVSTQLTAWTVTKHTDGLIYVHIRELRDPAGLQRKLRADGIPASVIFDDQQNPCRPYHARQTLLNKVFPGTFQQVHPPGPDHVIVIDPRAIPGKVGVQLSGSFPKPPAYSEVAAPILVHASPRCTG